MLLKKIIIKNFKGISEEQKIDFSVSNKANESLKNNLMFKKEGTSLIPLIIGFMGKNASGKTSIIDAIGIAIDLIFHPEIIFDHFYSQRILNKSKIKNQPFSMDASNENNKLINNFVQLSIENKIKLFPNEYNLLLESLFNDFSCDQKNPIEIEVEFIDEQNIYKTKLSLTKNELIRLTHKNNEIIEIERFPLIAFYNLHFFYNFIENSSILRMQWRLIEIIGRNKYNLILKMLDDNIKEINYTIDNAKKIRFTSLHMNNGTIIKFDFLSTGTIKILKCIAQMININNNSKYTLTIFIADEINNYLHTKLVEFLFHLLSRYLNNAQLIFTTHSPAILEITNRHAMWVIQNEEYTKIRKVGSIIREGNNAYKQFISEQISSHPSSAEINEVLYQLEKNKN